MIETHHFLCKAVEYEGVELVSHWRPFLRPQAQLFNVEEEVLSQIEEDWECHVRAPIMSMFIELEVQCQTSGMVPRRPRDCGRRKIMMYWHP